MQIEGLLNGLIAEANRTAQPVASAAPTVPTPVIPAATPALSEEDEGVSLF